MNNSNEYPRHRRRRHLVDQKLQLRLLLGLVLLELTLTALGTLYLFLVFNQILEAQLYMVHLPTNSGQDLFQQVAYVLLAIAVINTIALLIVDSVWRRYVDKTLQDMNARIGAISDSDFSQQFGHTTQHPVLELLYEWFNRERSLVIATVESLRHISGVLDRGDSASRRQAVIEAEKLKLILSTGQGDNSE